MPHGRVDAERDVGDVVVVLPNSSTLCSLGTMSWANFVERLPIGRREGGRFPHAGDHRVLALVPRPRMTRHRHPADDGGDAALVAGVDEAEVFELRVSSELVGGREVVVGR